MSRPTRMLLAIACAALALSPAAAAAAADTFYGPPGHSSVQEFTELMPDGAGLYNTNYIGHGILDRLGARNLAPADRRNIKALAAQDKAAAALAQAGAPAADPRARDQADTRADGESALSATVERVFGGAGPGGMGLALPILLLLGLVAALGVGARRAFAG